MSVPSTRLSRIAEIAHSARDRFLAPGGLMVPSQTRIILAGITGQQLWDEGFGFWDNVYGKFVVIIPRTCADAVTGFDMSAMRPTRCQDGLIEIVNAKEICTTETIVTVRLALSLIGSTADLFDITGYQYAHSYRQVARLPLRLRVATLGDRQRRAQSDSSIHHLVRHFLLVRLVVSWSSCPVAGMLDRILPRCCI